MSADAAMLIGGELIGGASAFDVDDPSTGVPFAHAPECSPGQLDSAFAAAAAAYPAWRAEEDTRREVLLAAADTIVRASSTLAPLISREQGKTLADASLEVVATSAWLKYYAGLEIPREVIRDNPRVHVEVTRRPLGVVAALTPWNYPIMLGAWKLGPALLAGNTTVLKPSPFSPLTALRMGELLADVVPPGVLNVVSGGADVGRGMVTHPTTRKVSFTGSVAAGQEIAGAAARDLKRLTLELGGNDPAILLDDVDPDAVAADLFWGAFHNNGQTCSAIKRVYAPESLADEITEALAELARAVRVGPALEPESELGPVGNRRQLERIAALVDDAARHGARVVCGGQPLPGPGWFYPPTIVAGTGDDRPLVADEQFGPALPVLSYGNVDEAVARANDSPLGLSASVWSEDPDRAASVAGRLECGTVWVNAHLILLPDQPFGGTKHSGTGVENGVRGLEEFTDLQVLHQVRR